jgi:hypothetical protein
MQRHLLFRTCCLVLFGATIIPTIIRPALLVLPTVEYLNVRPSVPLITPPTLAPPVIDFRNITVEATTAWHHEIQVAFADSLLSQRVSLIPYELNCYPHWPYYGKPMRNFYNGTQSSCNSQLSHGVCNLINEANYLGYSLWISTESLWRTEALSWGGCTRSSRRFYAAEVFYKSTRSKGIDIPIPTHTYAHAYNTYPLTRLNNQERCQSAVHDVTFKGQRKAPERVALERFVGRPGFAIEFNRQMGEMSERMTDLLRSSRFGLVPAGDGWHSYRLMETMAMGVVPIIISDDWSLPFEDILNWAEFSISVPLANISHLPTIVEDHRGRACEMSDQVFQVYHQYMANGTQIVRGIDESIRRHVNNSGWHK